MGDLLTGKIDNETLDSITKFLYDFEDGLILYDTNENRIKYVNRTADRIAGVKSGDKLQEIFSHEDIEKFRANKSITKYINNRTVRFTIENKDEKSVWVRLSGEEGLNRYEEGISKALELNRSMRKTLMEYDQSSLMISDGNGIVVFAGQETVDNCGHDKSWYIGRSIYDLEKQGVFYPSVTRMVLETGKEQVVIQKTALADKHLVAIGVPVFDENGQIEQVLSITKDYTAQVNLSSIIAKMEFGMNITESKGDALDEIITCNEKMIDIKNLIRLVAPTNSTVLILGETGTGKEVLAKAIHKMSKRSEKPFVVVSCGSLSPNIVESELFGYEAGSFTGANREGKKGLLESASGGTVFLDEIGELPLDQQVKLLHVLQEKSIVRVGGTEQIPLDIRVIAATNRDLREQIEKGNFREDLFYRLNVVSINIPSLSRRREDIPLFIKHFTKKFNEYHSTNKVISKNVMNLLSRHEWPGNVRELENLVERLIVTSPSNYIDAEDLPWEIPGITADESNTVTVKEIAPLAEVIESAERQLLEMARYEYGTTSAMAEILEVNQSTVSRKMKTYGIK
ncbi:MAG: sigma 54-interacting transcriptional regulator [Clostridiales bacterium]|nr:sigma 54-interacting transcriptional regulator [Clostridiales bacterium]